MEKPCFFCDVQKQSDPHKLVENKNCFARADGFPVSRGHAEIIMKRHVSSPFDLNDDEVLDAHHLVCEVKKILDEKYAPDGYNVGVNVGEAGGQSIPHVHIHVIPRYQGDVPNPRGGVRNILAGGDYAHAAVESGKGKYLE